jgi:carbohydrate-selective porin OprB
VVKIGQPGTGKTAKEKNYPGQYEFGSTYNGGKFASPFCSSVAQAPGCPGPESIYYTNPLYFSPNTGNYVVYFMANQAVYRTAAHSNRGLDVFFGYAGSPNSYYNMVDKNITGGAVFNAPFSSRPHDSIGFALSWDHVSDQYAKGFAYWNPTAPPYGSETGYEFNYLLQITPYWLVQPTVQLYQNVGGFSKYGTATAIGFRTKVDF